MGDLATRTECFCSYNPQDQNCYNGQDGFCPQKEDCEKAAAICKATFGEREPGIAFDYSDLSLEQKQQIEVAMDAPAAAKRARPGAVVATAVPVVPVVPTPVVPAALPTATVAGLGELEAQLQQEIAGPVQLVAPALPVALPPALPLAAAVSAKKKAGRKSKATKDAEAAALAAGQPSIPAALVAPVTPLVLAPVALPAPVVPVPLPKPVAMAISEPVDGMVTITMDRTLAEKLVASICHMIDGTQDEPIKGEPIAMSVRKRPGPKAAAKAGKKRGPKPGSKKKTTRKKK